MPALSLRALHNHSSRHSRVANSLPVRSANCSVPTIPSLAEEYGHIHVAATHHRACQTSTAGARLAEATLLARLLVDPPSSGQSPPSDSVYSCDLPWDNLSRRTTRFTESRQIKFPFREPVSATSVESIVRRPLFCFRHSRNSMGSRTISSGGMVS